MNMWDGLSPDALILAATAGNYGLAPKLWTRQLEEIRELPEPEAPDQPKET